MAAAAASGTNASGERGTTQREGGPVSVHSSLSILSSALSLIAPTFYLKTVEIVVVVSTFSPSRGHFVRPFYLFLHDAISITYTHT